MSACARLFFDLVEVPLFCEKTRQNGTNYI